MVATATQKLTLKHIGKNTGMNIPSQSTNRKILISRLGDKTKVEFT